MNYFGPNVGITDEDWITHFCFDFRSHIMGMISDAVKYYQSDDCVVDFFAGRDEEKIERFKSLGKIAEMIKEEEDDKGENIEHKELEKMKDSLLELLKEFLFCMRY